MMGFVSLVCVALFSLVFANGYLEFKKTSTWEPIEVEKYSMDSIRKKDGRYSVRFAAETVSLFVNKNGLGPVTGSALMYSVMSAYHSVFFLPDIQHLPERTREFYAEAALYHVFMRWDSSLAESWAGGFSPSFKEQSDALLGAKKLGLEEALSGMYSFISTIQATKALQYKQALTSGLEWKPELGVSDNDYRSVNYPSVFPVSLTKFPAPPAAGTPLDMFDKAHLRFALDTADIRHGKNSVFWQGSEGFAKNGGTGGFNPSDILQNIAFYHLSEKLSKREFIKASKDLSAILYQTGVEVWKKKYQYRTARPSMVEGKLNSYIGNPPFPGYPSGHAAFSSAAAHFLASLDPDNKDVYRSISDDAMKSRAWGGVHFASDNYAGKGLGHAVALQYLNGSEDDLNNVIYEATAQPGLIANVISIIENLRLFFSLDNKEEKLEFIEIENAFSVDGIKTSELTEKDIYSGGIALGDIVGDAVAEVLVTGKDSVAIFKFVGKGQELSFEKIWEHQNKDIEGAIYTHDRKRNVTGVLVVGRHAPRYFERLNDERVLNDKWVEFRVPSQFTWNTKWAYVYDFNGDGLNDIYLQEFVEQRFDEAMLPMGGEKGEDLYFYQNQAGTYDFNRFMPKTAATSGAGMIDINMDGIKEEVVIYDGGRPRFIDGNTGLDLNLNPGQYWELSGMSFTPLTTVYKGKKVVGVYISDISTGDKWPYKKPRENKDKIVVWDSEKQFITDIAEGRLNTALPEWSWGGEVFDFNRDGLDDIAIVSGFSASSPYVCNVRMYEQTEKGDFIYKPNSVSPSLGDFSPRSIVGYDFDRDGDKDILISGNRTIRFWENKSSFESSDLSGFTESTSSLGYSVQKTIQ